MASSFPTAIDSITKPYGSLSGGTDKLGTPGVIHGALHQIEIDAIIALQTKVGIDSSADTNSLDYKVALGIKKDGTTVTTASIPFAHGASFGGAVSILAATPSFSFSRIAGEQLTFAASGGQIVLTFFDGLVDPDILTWSTTLLAFTSTLQGAQLKSTVTTGTAPLIVASTTKVTNLNADLLDGKDIGTSGNTIPLLDGTNTWSGKQLFLDTNVTLRNPANTFTTTLLAGATTANRDVTLPNATCTLAGTNQNITWSNGNATWSNATSVVLTLTNSSTTQSFAINAVSGEFSISNKTTGHKYMFADPVTGSGDDVYFNSANGTVFQIAGVDRISFQDTTFFWSSTGSNIHLDFGTDDTYKWYIGATQEITWTAGLTTFKDAYNIAFGTTVGGKIGTSISQKIAFHNATPVVQRAGAAQAAVATTAATNVAPYGYTTAAQADAIVTLVNEIRAALVEKGLIKGSA